MTSKTPSSSTPSSPPLPPIVLKDFVVSSKLGMGSYGSVYKGRRKTGARDCVAVKCVLKSNLSKAEIDNLIMEISMLKKLKHEHVVQMIDFCWDANYIYIIMEYCGGGDLSHFIKSRKSLPEEVCKRFLQQLAMALKYLRSENIAHMDLKPSNILLSHVSSRPILKLADFGFATKFSNDELKTAVRGSPLYMAPEMVLHRKYDIKAELWSVGVILFECLFGRAPYKSSTVEELLVKVRNGYPIEIPDVPIISKECKDLLQRCLKRDPASRLTFEEFFTHPFLDLEHMPSDEASFKALSLLEEAVKEDKEGSLERALELYKSGLEYFVPMVHYERDQTKKRSLTEKARQYVKRAESIKYQLHPEEMARTSKLKVQQRSSVERSNLEELMSLSSVTPKMTTGLEIARDAEFYELEFQYYTAMEKYQAALGILLPLLNSEPGGKRKQLLHSEITRWMERAEGVKHLISVQENVLSNLEMGESLADRQCSVQ